MSFHELLPTLPNRFIGWLRFTFTWFKIYPMPPSLEFHASVDVHPMNSASETTMFNYRLHLQIRQKTSFSTYKSLPYKVINRVPRPNITTWNIFYFPKQLIIYIF